MDQQPSMRPQPTEAPKSKMGMLLVVLAIVVVVAVAVWAIYLR